MLGCRNSTGGSRSFASSIGLAFLSLFIAILLIAGGKAAYAQNLIPGDALGARYLKSSLVACKYETDATPEKMENKNFLPTPTQNSIALGGAYDPLSHYYFVVKKGGPVKKIMNCLDLYVSAIAKDQLQKIIDILTFPIQVLLTIYLIIVGIRLVFGDISGQRTRSELVMSLLMIAAVFYFVRQGITEYYKMFKITQAKTVELVTQNVSFKETFRSMGIQACDPKNDGTPTTVDDIWERFDCTIAYMLGSNYVRDPREATTNFTLIYVPFGPPIPVPVPPTIEESSKGDMRYTPFEMTAPDSSLLFILATGLFFVHPVGIFVFILVIMSIIFLAAAILQATVSYVIALVTITFLAMMGPIMIPMVLFQYTREMFLYWLRMLFAYTLAPALLFAYLAFMFHVLQFGIHGFPGSSYAGSAMYDFGVSKYYARLQKVLDNQTNKTMCSIIKTEAKTEEKEDPLQVPDLKQTIINSAPPAIQQALGNLQFQEKGKSAFTLDVPCLNIDDMVAGNEEKEVFIRGLVRSFTVLGMLLAITVAFMHNVMTFADKLAGLGAIGNITQAVNIYGRVANRIAKSVSGQ